jgi:glucose/arabinose dehydrogenase
MRRSHLAVQPPRRPAVETLEDRLVLATLPANFSEAAVATGLSSATAMEVSPQGKIFITEQAGTMEVWQDGARRQANFFANALLPTYNPSTDTGLIDNRGERGLLGVTFDPDYATNRFVYVYYTYAVNPDGNTSTATTIRNRVSRFTADASGELAVAGTEQVILELDNLSGATNHNGGAIHFGPDGKLYVAVGDNAAGANAQTLANRHGKMLRINKDGSIPTDNPFFTTAAGANRAIWALGLRNPFTFSFQPGTGRMHVNDVGQNTWEEINVGAPGANFGWATTEGDFNQATYPNFTRPFYAYSHGGGTFQGYAITGGAFYNPASPGANLFPASYQGDYFFADYVNNWINVIDLNSREVTRFATGANGTVDLRVTDDGALLYLSRGSNSVFRVVYTANQAPSITAQPQSQTVSTGGSATFTVTASGSTPLSYQWQKAEAGTSSFANISGATTASLVVSNAQSADNGDLFRVIVSNSFGSATSAAATLTVTANQPPSPTFTIDAGLTNGRFIAGQAITFSGSATDPEDGALGASRLTWRVDYITSIASGNPVIRPFVPEFSGQAGGSFIPATTGPYTLTDVAYRVVLTATDSNGAATTITRDILPNTAQLTVTTSPAGLQITVDGQPFTGPHTFASVVGFVRPIGAPASQTSGGTTYNFTSWSDGGAATHNLSTPLSNTTYTATYTPAAGLNVRVNFQDTTSQGFAGYLIDTGAAFGSRGNGQTYGWNVSNASTARNRNASNSPDERYDTLQHMQKPENPNAVWEIAVPNGTYTVRVVSGDPSHTDSVFRTNVEGVLAVSGTPTTANRWFEGTVTVTVSDGRLTVTNGAGASNNKINFVEISQGATGLPPIQQSTGADGLVVFEAERTDANVSQGGKSWSPYTALAGYSGTGALRALSNTGVNNNTGYVTNSPRLDYRINFVKTGVHYVWIRGQGATGADDSVHVGLNGQAVATADRITGFGTTYTWTRSTMDGVVATINVTTTGVHTLNIWMREDGTVVDKVVLTTSSAYTPTGTGPAAARLSGGTLAASSPTAGQGDAGSQLATLLEKLEELRRRSARWR